MPRIGLAILALALILSSALLFARPSQSPSALPSLRGEEAIESLKRQGLYDSLGQALAATRYKIGRDNSSTDSQAVYRAQNPAQGFDALFTSAGVSILPRRPANQTTQTASWQTALTLTGYGYKNDFIALTAPSLEATDNRIELRHKSADGTERSVIEWYVNRAEGLEQGFVIQTGPSKKIDSERLRVVMKISGDLKAETEDEGQAIRFSTQAGEEALRYDKLYVTDADGRKLAAQMRIEADELWLEVEDEGAAYPLTIDPTLTQQAKLFAMNGDRFDQFGGSVAIEGETAIIGAPGDGLGDGSRVGAAYVFVRTGTAWTQQAKLTASDGTEFDSFGNSVSISGETVAVGAYLGDTMPDDNRGAAYVFVRTGATWTQQARLLPNDLAAGDQFGGSISISENTIVVGAQFHNTNAGADAGAAYVFVRNGAAWSQQARLTPGDGAANFLFCWSVAIEGDTAIIGSRDGNDVSPGAIYVFVRTGAVWAQQAKHTANDRMTFHAFSLSVAISGETVLVGAPGDTTLGTQAGAAYVFACGNSTAWTEQSHLFAIDPEPIDGQGGFGGTFAISGETAIFGYPGDSRLPVVVNGGAAFVFVRTGATWAHQATLIANDARDLDFFGESVAIDGDTAIVGAAADDTPGGQNAGSAYVFVRSGTTWAQQAHLFASDGDSFDNFGQSVAISGETIVAGAFIDETSAGLAVGSAYVFVRTGTTWAEQAKLMASDGAAEDLFGRSVAIDGETIVVGAYADDTSAAATTGSAYVYVRTGTTWTEQAHLIASDAEQFASFGFSVAIDGETIVVGAFNDDTSAAANTGSAYVFVRSGTTWAEQAKLIASDAAVEDIFGHSVAISGETAVIGAGSDNTIAGEDAGSAYVFVRTGATWTEQAHLFASDAAARDRFGTTVAINGKTIISGSPNDDTARGVDLGSAYVFDSSCISPPTAVGLSSFTATAYDDGVSIEWSTGFEVSNLGFNLYRDHAGKRSAVGSSLIAGSALLVGSSTRLSAGHSYAWWDASTANLKQTLYWLEAVDLDGSTEWFGPVQIKYIGGAAPDRSRAALLGRRGLPQSAITAPLARSALPPASSQLAQPGDSNPALLPTIKIAVKAEGFYRISQPELLQAGLDPKIDPRLLQLLVDGQPLPIAIAGEHDGRLDPGDVMEFYAVGLDTASTDTRVYWLTTGAQFGLRINMVDPKAAPALSSSFPYTVERRDRTVYFSSLINGERENFFGPVISQAAVDQSLDLRHVAASSPERAVLEVALQGVTRVDHNVQVSLNGASVGSIVFSDQAAAMAKFNVPHSMLKEGDNQITLVAAGGPSDVSLVNYVRLKYAHYFTAENNALRFTAQAGRQVTVDGFANDRIRVFDVTDIGRVQELRASVNRAKNGHSVSASATGEGERTLLAFTSEQARRAASVTANRVSRLRDPSNGADLIIITRPQFVSSLARLVALRQGQGLAVALVDVEDVYDEFSFGQKTAQAIKEFLTYARTSWKRKPSFVLFGGDASLDPRNYLGLGDWDLVPTRLIDTRLMETASDDWLCDADGDGQADIAAGRLPFRNTDEASLMISKIIRYETGAVSESILIASDSADAYSFEAAGEQLKQLIPSHIRVEEVRRGELGDATANSRLIEAINRGQKIVNYTGHGSVDVWRGGLLTPADVVKLDNESRLSLFVTMTCLNGYFQDASLDSLAEMLLKAERGGAVAVWASTGMTAPEGQAAINQELYRLILGAGGQSLRLGEAVRRAKAATGDSDIRRSWILFGDPTMRLK